MNPMMGRGGYPGRQFSQGGMEMGGPGMGMSGAMGMGMGGGVGEPIFPSVKLRGLPFDALEDDIRMFLGCDPVDILMVHRDGRPSGEAFVVLSSPMHVDLALSKNRSYLGRRYVEVFRARKLDYYKAVAAEMMGGGPMSGLGGQRYGGGYGMGQQMGGTYGGGMQAPQRGGGGSTGYAGAEEGGGTILKLRGLPFSVQDEDIVEWFADPSLGITPLTTDSVFIVSENGRPSGIAFVELPTPEEATAAMAMNRKLMGSRYIEIFPANRGDLERYRARGGY